MKIKRTLPSISEVLIEKKKLEHPDLHRSAAEEANSPSHINIISEDVKAQEKEIISKIRSSKSKIFRNSGRTQIQKQQNKNISNNPENVFRQTESLAQIQKSASQVSFKNVEVHSEKVFDKIATFKHQTEKILNQKQQSHARTLTLEIINGVVATPHKNEDDENEQSFTHRRKIFSREKSNNSFTHEDHTKSLRNNTQNDSRKSLMNKIDNLEAVVKDLAGKLERSQNNSFSLSQTKSPIKRYNLDESYSMRRGGEDQETKRLKMQLEQMRRCEKIAKENQVLYSRLVEDIRDSPNRSGLGLGMDRSYGTRHSKILNFQDYYGDDQYGMEEDNGEISSPFLLQENTKSASFRVRAYPINN